MNPGTLARRLARVAVNRCLHPLGYDVVSLETLGARYNYKPNGYIDADVTVQAALASNQSVRDYVESVWDQRGAAERVVQEMGRAGALSPCDRMCEIGPGTGRFLELIIETARPRQYDIYETDDGWAAWLAKTYAPTVVRQEADGRTLGGTPNASCGLVHAHGVFVYLSLLHAVEYFLEMIRVCKPQGHIVFDYFPAEEWNEAVIMRWLASENRFPVVLPRATIISFFENRRGKLLHEFDCACGVGLSRYAVFRVG